MSDPRRTAGSGAARVRAHRRRLREQGLRPIQLWVPDVRVPGFDAEAARQSVLAARSSHAREDQDAVEALSSWDEA